ncbi:MAG: hypothetical protein QW304_07900 [Thermoproteota archaeon]
MTISIQVIEESISRTFLGKPPREIFILDGVIDVKKMGEVKTAIAMTRPGESIAVFTPLSRTDSPYHELLHSGLFGFGILGGEILADIGGKILDLKNRVLPGIRKRRVKYKLCTSCLSTEQILQRLKLQPAFEGRPNIRHYVLMEEE